MKNVFNLLTSIVAALMPLIGFNLVGLFIINDLPNSIGYSIAAIILLISLVISYGVYKFVMKMGILSFMATVSASPDLDDPLVTESSEHKLRTPQELAQLINQHVHLCKGGSVRIFGDWHRQHGEHFHRLVDASYTAFDKKLTLHFNQDEQIEIYKPLKITEGTTYLKIKSASKVIFKFHNSQTQCSLEFTKKGKKIEVNGNCQDVNEKVLVSLSAPALMLN